MLAASQKGNGRQIADTCKKIHTCQSTIDDLYADLESVTAEHDGQQDRLADTTGRIGEEESQSDYTLTGHPLSLCAINSQR